MLRLNLVPGLQLRKGTPINPELVILHGSQLTIAPIDLSRNPQDFKKPTAPPRPRPGESRPPDEKRA